jgi:indole-3-glycerol phosphate synthase
MSVLDELVAAARDRAKQLPPDEPDHNVTGPRFDDALQGKERLAVIAEFKQSSPSLGPIAKKNVTEQVRRYVQAGASAVSVLTEPTRFGGVYTHLSQASKAVLVPVLMKDFFVDTAQVRFAARLGARAVLLIIKCLSPTDLDELVSACRQYELVPLLECHNETELERALDVEDGVIGINNRNLDTLEIDLHLAPRLLRNVPSERVVIAESGYGRPEETAELVGLADGVLIGSALMKDDDPEGFIREVTR